MVFNIFFFSKYETEENVLIISLSNIAILENSSFNGNIEFVETDWNIFLWNEWQQLALYHENNLKCATTIDALWVLFRSVKISRRIWLGLNTKMARYHLLSRQVIFKSRVKSIKVSYLATPWFLFRDRVSILWVTENHCWFLSMVCSKMVIWKQNPVWDFPDSERVRNGRLGSDGLHCLSVIENYVTAIGYQVLLFRLLQKIEVNVKTSGKSGPVGAHGSINLLRKLHKSISV